METGVGAGLRDARTRRDLDLAEVEAAIKIRARYLRAIEDEDWDVLPGGAYTRAFIRTYATYLGLDGERLAEDYRRAVGPEAGERGTKGAEPVIGPATEAGRRRLPGRPLTALVTLLLVGLLVAVGLAGRDDGDSPAPQQEPAQRQGGQGAAAGEGTQLAGGADISIGLTASAEVWVCLLDSDGEPLLDGEILAPGEEAGPFSGDGFSAAFGNGGIELTIDGRRAQTAASSSPVGYEIGAGGELTSLEEGERPDCE